MHIMLDLETMGRRPSAPIIAIGAVAFDHAKIVDAFEVNVSLASAVNNGAVIDPDTVMWWMQQSDVARSALQKDSSALLSALADFREWLEKYLFVCKGVWGNGVGFDNIILTETYARIGQEAPWPFWLDRCYRTVKNLYPQVPFVRHGTHHNCLDDAKSQALHLIEISRKAGGIL